jgi:excisionase family DNA binding protein
MIKRLLLTPTKAAEQYGINRSKVYNWIRNKRFPYIKPDKELLFWQSDFEDFLQKNTVQGSVDDR